MQSAPLLIVQHISHEGPGILGDLLSGRGIRYDMVNLYACDRLPDPRGYQAVVTLGGPQSANDRDPAMRRELGNLEVVLAHDIPYFGICLGMQTLARAAGADVYACDEKETGWFHTDHQPYGIELTFEGRRDPLFAGCEGRLRVFQLHGETVAPADGLVLLARGSACSHQVIRAGTRAYGIQSHIELTRDMLAEWAVLDPDLKTIGRTKLLEEFDAFRRAYTLTGTTIFENFLSLAGL